MSVIQFACSGCGVTLKIANPALAGRKMKCPRCSAINVIPSPPDEAIPDEEEALVEPPPPPRPAAKKPAPPPAPRKPPPPPEPEEEEELDEEEEMPAPPPSRPKPRHVIPEPEEEEAVEEFEELPKSAPRAKAGKPRDMDSEEEELAEEDSFEEEPPRKSAKRPTPAFDEEEDEPLEEWEAKPRGKSRVQAVRHSEPDADEPEEEPAPAGFWGSPFMLAVGAIAGVLLVLAMGAFVFWIEDKAINTALSLKQGAGLVKTVPAAQVDPGNNNQLVHISGEASTDEMLNDTDFGLQVKALRLTRAVELYQWTETKTETKVESTKGGKKDKTVTTYSYKKVWSKDHPTPSKEFNEPKGHTNPLAKPYDDAKLQAEEVKVGAFTLTPKQVERLPVDEVLTVTPELLAKLPEDLKAKARPDSEGRLFLSGRGGSKPEAPEVGDVRIRYQLAKLQPVTVVARQAQATFEPYTPTGGEKIDLLRPGTHTAESMFAQAATATETGLWGLRVVGFAIIAFGLVLVNRRRAAISTGKVPSGIFGHFGISLAAALLSLPLVLLIIGGRWILHQPVTGGSLLGGGAVALIVAFFVAGRLMPRAKAVKRQTMEDDEELSPVSEVAEEEEAPRRKIAQRRGAEPEEEDKEEEPPRAARSSSRSLEEDEDEEQPRRRR